MKLEEALIECLNGKMITNNVKPGAENIPFSDLKYDPSILPEVKWMIYWDRQKSKFIQRFKNRSEFEDITFLRNDHWYVFNPQEPLFKYGELVFFFGRAKELMRVIFIEGDGNYILCSPTLKEEDILSGFKYDSHLNTYTSRFKVISCSAKNLGQIPSFNGTNDHDLWWKIDLTGNMC